MKKFSLLIIASILIITGVFAQVPNQFKYQAVLRDASGNVLADQDVIVDISILQGTATGTSVFDETHSITTTAQGLINLNIGSINDMSTIVWSTNTYFVEVSVDGTTMGTSQLLSVPYALHAKIADDYTETDPVFGVSIANGINATDTANWNDKLDFEVDGSITNEIQTLTMNGNELSISTGNTVTLPGGSGGNANIPLYTSIEIAALSPIEGDAIYNTTESLFQIYTGSSWVAFSTSTCWPQPTNASTGNSQYFNNGSTSTNLEGNTPEPSHGIGSWSIVSGLGGSFTDINNPTTTFTGLLGNSYSLRWTITTSCNTSTSNPVIITFGQDISGTQLTDVDGNTYNTVSINGKLWMAENLKVTQYSDNTPISLITDAGTWAALGDNSTDKAYCYYNNDAGGEATIYGALYTWAAAMNGEGSSSANPSGVQGVCPIGWHLPSYAEYTELINYLGGSMGAGKFVTGTTYWNSPNPDATNSTGFSALPGGRRDGNNGEFSYLGDLAQWWTTTDIDVMSTHASTSIVENGFIFGGGGGIYKSTGFSVRCIQD